MWRRRKRQEQDLHDEIAAHLAIDMQDRIDDGDDPDAARRLALRDFGNVTRAAEATRETWRWSGLEQALQDLRIAARTARRHPGFTLAAMLTLGISVGAATAILSVAYYTWLAPLPFDDPSRLVRVFEAQRAPLSPQTYLDWKTQARAFEGIAAFRQAPRAIQSADGVEQVGGMQVTADFFALLGVAAQHGRTFILEDDLKGAEQVAVVTHKFWRSRLGGDPAAIGRSLTLNGERFTLIGVLPAPFRFTPNDVDVWTPLRLAEDPRVASRTERFLQAVGRLRKDITVAQAEAEADAIAARTPLPPSPGPPRGADLVPLREALVGSLRDPVFVLLGASALVLVIGCFNLTNLFVARSIAREREIDVRVALGASRSRLLRQLGVESAAIGLAGAALATLLCVWAIGLLLPLAGTLGGAYAFVAARMLEAGVGWRVLACTLTLSLVAALCCTLLSAGSATRVRSAGNLLSAARGSSAARSQTRLRSVLVVAEIALTLALLSGAGLLVNSVWRLHQVDLGFEPSRLLTLRLHSTPPEAIDFYCSVLERARVLPGIESATIVSSLPLLGVDLATNVAIEHRLPPADGSSSQAVYKVVGDRYFETLGIRLIDGRSFDRRDASDAEPVVIVNRAMAKEFWPGESPIGRRVRRGGPKRPWSTVVGVVEDVKVSGPDAETPSELYVPHAQFLFAPASRLAMPNMTLVVRTASDPLQQVAPLRAQIRGAQATTLVTQIEAMDQALSRVLAPRHLSAGVLSAFAGVALGLAIVGLYGVISYSVAQRRQEMGIRMALGARGSQLLVLVLRQAVQLAMLGAVLGVAASLALTRWMSALLFEVRTTDPTVLGVVIAVVLGVSVIASYVPARRAATIDPLVALRAE
jgi:putative ABC transport system permease protein